MYNYKIGLLRKVRTHLKNGGVIAYPTEFCYGLGCDPNNYQAINKILKLKLRSRDKGLIVIASREEQLQSLIDTDLNIEYSRQQLSKKFERYWPGPNTLLLPLNKKNVRYNLVGKHTKLAVRVTKHRLVRQLCAYLNIALVSTSANKSGHKPVKTYRDCLHQFGSNKILVLPGATNFAKYPSAIIDFASQQKLR